MRTGGMVDGGVWMMATPYTQLLPDVGTTLLTRSDASGGILNNPALKAGRQLAASEGADLASLLSAAANSVSMHNYLLCNHASNVGAALCSAVLRRIGTSLSAATAAWRVTSSTPSSSISCMWTRRSTATKT